MALPRLQALIVENGAVAARVLDPPGVVLKKNPRVPTGHDLALGPFDDEAAGRIAAEGGFEIRNGSGLVGVEVFENYPRHEAGWETLPGQDDTRRTSRPVNPVSLTRPVPTSSVPLTCSCT
jgi:hypothetical protein